MANVEICPGNDLLEPRRVCVRAAELAARGQINAALEMLEVALRHHPGHAWLSERAAYMNGRSRP